MADRPSNKPGRPRLDPAGTVAVTVALPVKQYDAYCRQALREAVSLPEVIRRHLRYPPDKYLKIRHG